MALNNGKPVGQWQFYQHKWALNWSLTLQDTQGLVFREHRLLLRSVGFSVFTLSTAVLSSCSADQMKIQCGWLRASCLTPTHGMLSLAFLQKVFSFLFSWSDSLKLSNQSEQSLINWLNIYSTQLGNFVYFVKNLTEQNWAGHKYWPLDNSEDHCGTCAWKHTDSSTYI